MNFLPRIFVLDLPIPESAALQDHMQILKKRRTAWIRESYEWFAILQDYSMILLGQVSRMEYR